MIQIIPAIDIINGKCVRLSKGEYDTSKVYHEDPVEVAKQFESAGFRRLHLVDLDGAKAGEVKNIAVLENISRATQLQVDFSGGISTSNAVIEVFNAGASLISIGSVAVKKQSLFIEWIQNHGAGKFLLGADVRDNMIAVKGWTEMTKVSVFELIDTYRQHGINAVFCTDVSKDGMLQGPSIALYQDILERFAGLQLIASGGVSKVEDIEQLQNIGCAGVIIGKAFYEGHIRPEALKKYVD